MTDRPDLDEQVRRLLARGVPWYLAREAVYSTALERDDDAPGWLVERDDDEGLRMLGHGEDDE
jgi:hypothetical protein